MSLPNFVHDVNTTILAQTNDVRIGLDEGVSSRIDNMNFSVSPDVANILFWAGVVLAFFALGAALSGLVSSKSANQPWTKRLNLNRCLPMAAVAVALMRVEDIFWALKTLLKFAGSILGFFTSAI